MPVGEDSSPASFETSGGGEHLTPRWPSSNSIVNASSGWLSAGTLNFTLTIIRLATCSQKLNLLGRSAATYTKAALGVLLENVNTIHDTIKKGGWCTWHTCALTCAWAYYANMPREQRGAPGVRRRQRPLGTSHVQSPLAHARSARLSAMQSVQPATSHANGTKGDRTPARAERPLRDRSCRCSSPLYSSKAE